MREEIKNTNYSQFSHFFLHRLHSTYPLYVQQCDSSHCFSTFLPNAFKTFFFSTLALAFWEIRLETGEGIFPDPFELQISPHSLDLTGLGAFPERLPLAEFSRRRVRHSELES